MRHVLLIGTLVVVWLMLAPAGASAATCSDYSNQADAQRAADTRDADGDGIYCEALPCPCLYGGGGGGGGGSPTPRPRPKPKPKKSGKRYVGRITSVIDGDTIRVRLRGGRYERVRLIGIDTPETRRPGRPVECGAKRATAVAWRIGFGNRAFDDDGDGLEDTADDGSGRAVVLRTDPTQGKRDRYGRLLAYVTLTATGRSFAVEQLRRGWAKVYIYRGKPFQQLTRFTRASRRARGGPRGVFRRCGGNFHART